MAESTQKLVSLGELETALLRAKKEFQETVFRAEKSNPEDSDTKVIQDYFVQNQDPAAKSGDVFIVETKNDDAASDFSAYIYDGSDWIAVAGNVDADKVILRNNITMAGNYTQVGNKTKAQNGTAEFATKGNFPP